MASVNVPRVSLKDSWKGLVEIIGDIVYFSDDAWDSDSESGDKPCIR